MHSIQVNCRKCKFFYITWDKKFPNGCRFFAFKTNKMPSISVLEASGKKCLNFQCKESKSTEQEPQNNDKELDRYI